MTNYPALFLFSNFVPADISSGPSIPISISERGKLSLFTLELLFLFWGENYGMISEPMAGKWTGKIDFRKIAELSSLVLMLPSSVAVGLFFGYLLDKLFGTHPWLLLVFLLLGTVSGFYSLIRGLSKFKDE